MQQQQRNRGHQTEGGTVHGLGNTGRERRGPGPQGLAVASAAKAVMTPIYRAEQSEEGGDIRKQRQVRRAFSSWGTITIMLSSMAICICNRRLTAPWQAGPWTTSARWSTGPR